MSGFAVIDLETTGFAYNNTDRVCEIGVVLVDADGCREDSWTTLVNPQRNLGAQHVHRIDATDARMAPVFADVVGDLTDLLVGRCRKRTTARSALRFWWPSMHGPGGRLASRRT